MQYTLFYKNNFIRIYAQIWLNNENKLRKARAQKIIKKIFITLKSKTKKPKWDIIQGVKITNSNKSN